jgi:citrate lyase subunit alpha/citrate CoA-transferase
VLPLASTAILADYLRKDNIHIGLGLGGVTKAMCDLQDEGLVDKIVDCQDFDLGGIEGIKESS